MFVNESSLLIANRVQTHAHLGEKDRIVELPISIAVKEWHVLHRLVEFVFHEMEAKLKWE